ncbi:MAG: hypothetical protein CMJ45_08690 [Planctomyces sp.]|nr:hypothetical protein [Planctomyces sp.]
MRIKLRNFGWLLTGGVLLAAIACGSAAPAATGSVSTPIPTLDIPATVSAKGPAVPLRIPTATPVSPEVQQTAQQFNTGYDAINQDWDQLHQDFDAWRQGLITCDPSAVQASLVRFSGSIAGTTETARSLSRHSSVRGLADQLIQAAEQEEEALRLLRDTWKPDLGEEESEPEAASNGNGNGFGSDSDDSDVGEQNESSVFEGVAVARSAASAIQKRVADQLSDLQQQTTPAAKNKVDDFDTAVQSASSDWDRFHRNYDSFRTVQGSLTAEEAADRLGDLVNEFRDVVLAVRDLPSTPSTDIAASLLATAVEDEDLALRLLRGAIPNGEEGNGDALDTGEPTLFDFFDVEVVDANAARRQAGQELSAALESVSSDSRNAIDAFVAQYTALNEEWTAFHGDYDGWRSTEGGCDRTKAVQDLGGFAIRASELSGNVRDLPRATFLRPMGELMVEAAEREEGALKELRTSWRPFDPQVFQTLDRQRNTSGKLRRQVALGIQELLESYGIASPASGS